MLLLPYIYLTFKWTQLDTGQTHAWVLSEMLSINQLTLLKVWVGDCPALLTRLVLQGWI